MSVWEAKASSGPSERKKAAQEVIETALAEGIGYLISPPGPTPEVKPITD